MSDADGDGIACTLHRVLMLTTARAARRMIGAGLSGCDCSQGNRALSGSLIGAGNGAAIGAGAALGAAAGGVGGLPSAP